MSETYSVPTVVKDLFKGMLTVILLGVCSFSLLLIVVLILLITLVKCESRPNGVQSICPRPVTAHVPPKWAGKRYYKKTKPVSSTMILTLDSNTFQRVLDKCVTGNLQITGLSAEVTWPNTEHSG